jgi:hypothetical protein
MAEEDFENLKYTLLYLVQVKHQPVLDVMTPHIENLNNVYFNQLYTRMTTDVGKTRSRLFFIGI